MPDSVLAGVIAAASKLETPLSIPSRLGERAGVGCGFRMEALAAYCSRALWPEPRWLVAEQGSAPPAGGPRLLTRVREAIRTRHLSPRTEEAYVFWIRRYVLFHGKRHPAELGAAEVTRFLSNLAVAERVSASTQNQALSALLFLYRRVLHVDLPWLEGVVRAKRPARLPVVLSRDEVAAVLAHLDGVRWLVAALLYGAGLRLLECLQLRVKDWTWRGTRSSCAPGRATATAARCCRWPSGTRSQRSSSVSAACTRRSGEWRGLGGPPARARAEVSRCPSRAGLAMGLSRHAPPSPRRDGGAAPPPLSRVGDPTRSQARPRPGGDRQACGLPHLPPLLRDSPARGRLRYPYRPGAPWPPRHPDDDGLHARPQPRWPRGRQPCRPPGGLRLAPCGIRSRLAAAHRRETGSVGFHGTGVFSATSATSRSAELRSG